MTTDTDTTTRAPLHRPAGTGTTYMGPGDLYRFLIIDAVAARYATAAPRYGIQFTA